MKIIISESQHRRLFEEEQKVLHLPSAKVFGGWDELQRYLELKGNPPYSIGGDLLLQNTSIKSLGNLTSVGGILRLRNTSIESLGDLTHVGGNLFLEDTPIESFGNLKSVGGDLDIFLTPISKKYSVEEIRQMVNVGGTLFM